MKFKKNILQGGKPEMTYITGGKTLLTLFRNSSHILEVFSDFMGV